MRKGKKLLNQIHLGYFILGIVAVIITGFCSGIGNMAGKSISIVEMLLNHDEEIRLQVTWLDAFNSALYGWLILLLPVITAIPVLPLFCDEINSRNYQFQIVRVGFSRYINRHFISAFLSGFFLVAVALSLYALIMGQIFPSVHDFGDMLIIGYEEMDKGEMLQQVLNHVLWFGLLGGMFAVFSSAFIAITRNIYIILAVPFLITYLCNGFLMMAHSYVVITLTIIFYLLGYLVWYIKYRRLAL